MKTDTDEAEARREKAVLDVTYTNRDLKGWTPTLFCLFYFFPQTDIMDLGTTLFLSIPSRKTCLSFGKRKPF